MNIAGIVRKTEFSPNHVMNDYLIIKATADLLIRLGADVCIYSEDDLMSRDVAEDYIFSMVQSPTGIKRLLELSRNKKLVVNNPQSVINCYRYNLVRILSQDGINSPDSIIIATNNPDLTLIESLNCKKWIKRGDAHAVSAKDVVFIDRNDELERILSDFQERNIDRCVIQNHIEGDTIKFYSILDTDFFHCYGTDLKHGNKFSVNELRETANKAATSLGLEIFGGDAIITRDSEIYIVDINDWPSFAPVRNQAGEAIGKYIYNKIQTLQK